MSFQTLRWAEQQRVGNANRKSVLLCLAQFADENHSCFPGQAKIAQLTEMAERTVRGHLARLEKDQLIQRSRRQTEGRHGRNTDRYVLNVSGTLFQAAEVAGKDSGTQPASDDTSPADANTQPASDDTSFLKDLPEEQPKELAGFEQFWETYPTRHGKKVDKAKAENQWDRISQAESELSVRAVENYRVSCSQGLAIAKDAHRWLRDKNWLDWQTPARPDPKPGEVVPRFPVYTPEDRAHIEGLAADGAAGPTRTEDEVARARELTRQLSGRSS